jgi:hypothetical protein
MMMYWENMDFSRRLASYEGSRPYTPLVFCCGIQWMAYPAVKSF